jgi:uncharacterized membrane protein
MNSNRTRKLVYAAMFAVINYVAFTYGKITIPVTAGTSTAIHIANAVVVLSSWFLGPVYGGLAGAIGLSIADLIDPRYITSAPKTFILKFMIGFIAGTIARKLDLKHKTERNEIIMVAGLSAFVGLGFNVLFDPIVGYFYRQYILGIPQEAAKIIATWVAGATAINAIVCVFVAVILYLALYKTFLNRVPE